MHRHIGAVCCTKPRTLAGPPLLLLLLPLPAGSGCCRHQDCVLPLQLLQLDVLVAVSGVSPAAARSKQAHCTSAGVLIQGAAARDWVQRCGGACFAEHRAWGQGGAQSAHGAGKGGALTAGRRAGARAHTNGRPTEPGHIRTYSQHLRERGGAARQQSKASTAGGPRNTGQQGGGTRGDASWLGAGGWRGGVQGGHLASVSASASAFGGESVSGT